MELYKTIEVWERLEEGRIVNYRCLQMIPEKKYIVQSADFYTIPITNEQIMLHKQQFLELFYEEDPCVRTETIFDTVEEAIFNHKKEFSEFNEP